MPLDLDSLTDDAPLELTGQLHVDLDNFKRHLDAIVHSERLDGLKLAKPGVKLAINTAAGVTGLALAPLSSGWSLLLTIVTSAVTISDAHDFFVDYQDIRSDRRYVRRIHRTVADIVEELEVIERILQQRRRGLRYGP